MRSTLFLTAAAALAIAAPAFAAQPVRSDQIKRDDDPYIMAPIPNPSEKEQEQTTPRQTRQFVAQTDAEGRIVANAPIPDTRENRERYGQPLSRAGKRTAARGN